MTGTIYKIVCSRDNETYVGSTFDTLRGRMRGHRNTATTGKMKNWLAKYPRESYAILPIREIETDDRRIMEVYEQLAINRLRPTLNSSSAFNPVSLILKKRYQYIIPIDGRTYIKVLRNTTEEIR